MGMEQQMGGLSNTSNEQIQMSADEIVGVRNDLQIKIAEKYHIDLIKFIDLYAVAVGRLIKDDPNLLREYKSNPDGTLEKVGKIVIH